MAYPCLASANLPVHVLHFDGSVLEGEDALDVAIREIERTAAEGARVLAVTAAFPGATHRLLAAARARFGSPSPDALASLLATGEATSAAFLSLGLGASGIPNALLDADRINLRLRGPALEAEPVEVDVEAIEKALSAQGVAVLPGFSGRRRSGAIGFVGTGGSELTALFLAERLGAEECRLVTARPPERYRAASWEELVRARGAMVSPRAAEFAQRHRLSFAIAAPFSETPTRIGPVTERVRS